MGNKKVKSYSKYWANQFLKDFIENENFKGPNFKWENFPTMSAKLGSKSLFMSYDSYPIEPTKKEELDCYEEIKRITEQLIQKSNLK